MADGTHEAIDALLAHHGGRDLPALSLTDEEPYVVTAAVPPAARLVPLAYLEGLPDEHQVVAARSAYRSLSVRGLVAHATDGRPTETSDQVVELEVQAPLITVIDALEAPGRRVLASRTTDGLLHQRASVTLEGRAALVQVAEGGAHRFWFLDAIDACEELVGFIDPFGVADEGPDGELARGPRDAPPAEWEELQRHVHEGAPHTRVIAGTEEPGHVLDLLFLTSDDGLWLLAAAPVHGSDGAVPDELVVRRLSAPTLLVTCADVLGLREPLVAAVETR